MTLDEQKGVIRKGCEYVAGRVPVLASVGRSTATQTIGLTSYAYECGVKWGLTLPPYYHPTTEKGIKIFYKEIAAGSKLGLMIYNNSGVTAVNLSPQLMAELAEVDNIVAVKDIDELSYIVELQD
jgi:4-hydroxy-tetrahydrodipicolinate synthase